MAAPETPNRGLAPQSWRGQLSEYCRILEYPAPVYNIVSDRRGGRTAWSATVTVRSVPSNSQQTIQARRWYDGEHVNNAREDAAEVALRFLRGETTPSAMAAPPPTAATPPKAPLVTAVPVNETAES